jgi:3-hydroxypropanoate dehydrogenase
MLKERCCYSASIMTTASAPLEPAVLDAISVKSARALDDRALRTLFTDARSANGFLPQPIGRELIEKIYRLSILGMTASNALPMRLVIIDSDEGKERLLRSTHARNIEKTKSSPVTIIVAADLHFHEHIPRLWPHAPENALRFQGTENAAFAKQFALTNATLQGAYFMLAARALGLDVGPMGIYDKESLDGEFFPDGQHTGIFLIGLGYGDDSKIGDRLPRFAFSEVATFV